MLLDENLRVAFTALRANKMRSALTALGIIIGVAAVIAVVSIVQGLQYMITGQLQNVGATFIAIQPVQEFGGPGMVQRQVRLTWEDGQAIAQHVRNVSMITPQIFGQTEIKYRDRQHKPFVIGVNQDWPEVNKFNVDRGRFFSRLDLDRRSKVAVVGTGVVEDLKIPDPIGAEIYVGNTPLTIIGVMEKKGRALGFDYDDMAFVPFDTALGIFGRHAADQVQLQLQAASSETVDQVKDDIKRLLRERHHIGPDQADDFRVLVQNEILDIYSKILGGVTAVVGAIVGVALLVGGIGIMNIMLVSVTERTREIGIRKSVGARRRDILVQFLIEAVTLALVGGVIGILLGYGVGAFAVKLIPGDFPAAHVPLWAVLIAFGFCSLVGVAFGIYPASKAARLDPIEALRYE
jgi:putative ABC transport system permease protein